MAEILNFIRKSLAAAPSGTAGLAAFLDGYSIEVTPRTAAKVRDFRAILPPGTRVYVSHIDGTDTADLVAACARLVDEGLVPMPHVPARGIASRAELDARLAAYAGVGVRQALAIAGGIGRARGPFGDSMAMLETGLFDAHGFARVHVAGHPEGSRDIDPGGGDAAAMAALRWKDAFQSRTDAAMALVTQFAFEPEPIIAWAGRLRAAGVTLPIHVGVAGPAKLQTLIRYAMSCGVGPSLRVLQRRAADLSNLILPFEPTAILAALARHKAAHPDCLIEAAHLFPLGGVAATTDYAGTVLSTPVRARA